MIPRMNGFPTTSGLAVTTLIALLGLTACGKSDEGGPVTRKKKAEPVATAPGASDEQSRLANAVVSGKTSAPVDLKYDLAVKPVSGQPIEIELAFQPRLPADTLDVEVTGMPGLVVLGPANFKFQQVLAGTTYTQKVQVQADADGTYYASVLAKMVTQVQTEARSFSVPVVVGTTPAAVAKPAPKLDAAGQPIQPMPAKESGQ